MTRPYPDVFQDEGGSQTASGGGGTFVETAPAELIAIPSYNCRLVIRFLTKPHPGVHWPDSSTKATEVLLPEHGCLAGGNLSIWVSVASTAAWKLAQAQAVEVLLLGAQAWADAGAPLQARL